MEHQSRYCGNGYINTLMFPNYAGEGNFWVTLKPWIGLPSQPAERNLMSNTAIYWMGQTLPHYSPQKKIFSSDFRRTILKRILLALHLRRCVTSTLIWQIVILHQTNYIPSSKAPLTQLFTDSHPQKLSKRQWVVTPWALAQKAALPMFCQPLKHNRQPDLILFLISSLSTLMAL